MRYSLYIILLIYFFHENKNILSLVNSLLFSNICVFLYIIFLQRNLNLSYFNFKMFKDLLKVSVPLTPRVLFGSINSKVDKIFITLLANVESTGVYAIGQSVAYSVFQLMSSLDKVFLTKLNYSLFGNKMKDIGNKLMPFIAMTFIFTFFLILFVDELLYFFINQNYTNSKYIIIFFSIFHLSLFFGKISSTQLIFRKKIWLNSSIFILNIFLNMIFNIPLIIYYDLYGAMIATILSGLICLIISVHYAKKFDRQIRYNYFQIISMFLSLIFITAAHYFVFDKLSNYYTVIIFIKILLALFPYFIFRELITYNNIKKLINVQ